MTEEEADIQRLAFFNWLEEQQAKDRPFLKKHKLDTDLWWKPGKLNLTEVNRQSDYLLKLVDENPDLPEGELSTIKRRALELIGCFVPFRAEESVPSSLVVLLGRLLCPYKPDIKFIKKGAQLLAAQAYVKEDPDAAVQKIADAAKVSRKTIWEWRQKGWL